MEKHKMNSYIHFSIKREMSKYTLQPFPLYEELAQKSNNLTVDMNKLSTLVSQLDGPRSEVFFSLIIHHAIKTGRPLPKNIPYDGKMFFGNAGIQFKNKDLPIELLKILFVFAQNLNLLTGHQDTSNN